MYYKLTVAIAAILLSNILSAQALKSSLKVGDPAPGLTIYKWVRGTPVTEFELGKIYVIEFGATWCAPCARAIPKLSALAISYRDDVHVLSLFVMGRDSALNKYGEHPYAVDVERYVAKRQELIHYTVGMDTPEGNLVNDWVSRTGIAGIPVVVVIDRQGRIAWMGNHVSAVKPIIDGIRANQLSYPADNEPDESKNTFDPARLLLIHGNGGPDTSFLFRSILTRYDGKTRAPNPTFIGSYYWAKSIPEYAHKRNRVQLIGRSIEQLYYLAYSDTLSNTIRFRNVNEVYSDTTRLTHLKTSYGKYWHKVVLEVKDTMSFYWSNKSPQYKFSYSLKVPEGAGTAATLQRALQNDLRTYFGYNVSVETRMMAYWRLSTLDEKLAASHLVSKDQNGQYQMVHKEGFFTIKNAQVRDIITMLASTYGFGMFDYGRLPKREQGAFIDKTGIKAKIDFTFNKNNSFDETRKLLAATGLELSRDYKPMKVVVIRDE